MTTKYTCPYFVHIVYFVVIVMVGCGVYFLVNKMHDDPESFGGKREWSVVQSVEYEHRGEPITSVIFIREEEYELVGIPAGRSSTIWVMLNPQYYPYYKQLPQGSFNLSKGDFEQIRIRGITTETVLNCLVSHINKD